MMRRAATRRSGATGARSRGLATVEFAVTAPFILFLLLAGAEFGRAFVQYSVLAHSVRNAARFVSEHAINGTTGRISISGTVANQARNLAVFGNAAGSGSAKLVGCAAGCVVTVVAAGGDNIRVTATYPYQPMIGAVLPRFGLGGGGDLPLAFNMRIVVTMRAIS